MVIKEGVGMEIFCEGEEAKMTERDVEGAVGVGEGT